MMKTVEHRQEHSQTDDHGHDQARDQTDDHRHDQARDQSPGEAPARGQRPAHRPEDVQAGNEQHEQARRAATLDAGLGSELTSIGFARLARALSEVAGEAGISQLSFRSPGRVGVGRAIRRNADGSATVAVRYRNRPSLSVAADMIEGVVQAGGTSLVTSEVRDELWLAAGLVLGNESGPSLRSNTTSSPRKSASGGSHTSAAHRRPAGTGSGPPDKATRRAA
ncbi:MAG: hypothetical protein OER95_01885 [Acidimicrobiia bacterium]|nr:hypothetical protein [Acidimicrobiia bacterium]